MVEPTYVPVAPAEDGAELAGGAGAALDVGFGAELGVGAGDDDGSVAVEAEVADDSVAAPAAAV
jgi:hypothetical protein